MLVAIYKVAPLLGAGLVTFIIVVSKSVIENASYLEALRSVEGQAYLKGARIIGGLALASSLIAWAIYRYKSYRPPWLWILGNQVDTGPRVSSLLTGAILGLTIGFAYLASIILAVESPNSAISSGVYINEDHTLTYALGIVIAIQFLATCLFIPSLEEVVFRGVAFDALARRFNTIGAAVMVTTLFWFMHLPRFYFSGRLAVLASIGALGICTVWLRVRTEGIAAPISCHAVYNTVLWAYSMYFYHNFHI